MLVDWRLFENPFLSLDEIVLPVRTFGDQTAILGGLGAMVEIILRNLGERDQDGTFVLRDEWARFESVEIGAGRPSTAAAMIGFWSEMPIALRHLEEWPVLAELASSGTALFLLGAHHELSVWLESAHDDEEAKKVKERLKDILTGFTDTLSPNPVQFDYEVLAYRADVPRRILASSDTFDLNDFHDLEHTVEGAFNDLGVFTGTVKAFGKNLGERIVPHPVRSRPHAGTDPDRLLLRSAPSSR